MTILFSGLQATLTGVKAENVLAIPDGLKIADKAQAIRASLDASVFPVGTTTVSIGISTDNQASFRVASMTCQGGVIPKGSKWVLEYALDSVSLPTHTKITIEAPLGFTSNMVVEAL